MASRTEVRRAARPAPLLDAGDGNPQRRLRLDEHAHVQDAVLLRADELLAVVEQHTRVERVFHDQLGDAPRFVDLAHAQSAGEGLVERDVRRHRIASGKERGDDDPAVLQELAQLEGVLDHLRLPFSVSRRSRDTGPRTLRRDCITHH
ncbi:MAG TPA: hypothetical protein VFR38_16925 [Gaiellaceae bacterium]|nr:hypothetical protein [Gaiellaceae bacterium]